MGKCLVTLGSDDCMFVPVQNCGSECICLKKSLNIGTLSYIKSVEVNVGDSRVKSGMVEEVTADVTVRGTKNCMNESNTEDGNSSTFI